jgi:DNA invertase Pin-like site-specific DNA recombinase
MTSSKSLTTIMLTRGVIMKRAYVYIRFSSKIQEQGDSIRRQRELAQRYCKEHNLEIIAEFLDDGVSAFRGGNSDYGKLREFIDKVETGEIESSSILLVESVDRISREDWFDAFTLIRSIVMLGITIVLTQDRRVINSENITDFGFAIITMVGNQAANIESKKKSERGLEIWQNKHRLAKEHNTPLSKLCPVWIELKDGKYIIKQKEADVLRIIIDLYLNGIGYVGIEQYMNKNYDTLRVSENKKAKQWSAKNIRIFLFNPAINGTYIIKERHNNSRKAKDCKIIDTIPNYYPKLVADEEWAKIQLTKQSRNRGMGGRKAPVINILAHITKCGYCGSAMIKINRTGAKNKTEQRYIVCSAGKASATNCTATGWNITNLESLVLRLLSELNIDTILDKDDKRTLNALEDVITKLEYDLTVATRKKERADADLADEEDDDLRRILKEQYKKHLQTTKDINAQLQLLQLEFENTKSEYNSMERAQSNLIALWKILNEQNVRQSVKTEIAKIVKKISLFNKEKELTIEYKNGKIRTYTSGTNYSLVINNAAEMKGKNLVIDRNPRPAEDDYDDFNAIIQSEPL